MGQGQIFQRSYKAADGTVKTCKTWTIRWYRNGRPHEEATRYTRKGDAQRLLNLRNGDLAHGKPITAAQFKLTFDDAAKTVLNDFKANDQASIEVVQRRITKHLEPFFGGRRLADISGDHILAYIAQRQAATEVVREAYDVKLKDGTIRQIPEHRREAPVSNAEINRELQVLKRCFSLALQHGKIFTKPHIPKLAEAAPRTGFFDREQVQTVCRHLPAALRGLVEFGFITGWRLADEVQTLQWHQVDMAAGEVRLEAGTTKNGEGRVFRFTAELRTVLETQRTAAEAAQREHDCVVPWVFFRLVAKGRKGPKQPKPIKRFTKAWRKACAAAGLPGRIPHDLRRSAVRSFVRAGISESVSMKLSGHKTRSVFDRYNITSAADLSDASVKLDAAANRDSSVTVTPKRAARAARLRRIS